MDFLFVKKFKYFKLLIWVKVNFPKVKFYYHEGGKMFHLNTLGYPKKISKYYSKSL